LNKKIVIWSSLSLLVASTIFVSVYFTVFNQEDTHFGAILIWEDSDFKSYKFSGEGTEEKPFLIENLFINTTNARGIFISGTSKYFVIRNCVIKAVYTGIHITDVASGTASIINNTCNDLKSGIYIQNSPSTVLQDNNCTNSIKENGITIVNSPYCIVSGNICNSNYGINERGDNYGNGISITNSENCEVINNVCNNNNGNGISLFYSAASNISSNVMNNNRISGIKVYDSEEVIIHYNQMVDNILLIDRTLDLPEYYFQSFDILGNTINEINLGYYVNTDDIELSSSSDGQIFFVNCNNISISNFEEEELLNIALIYCDDVRIEDSIFNNKKYNGITLYHCLNPILVNVTCISNESIGIEIHYTTNPIIENSTCVDNGLVGIFIHWASNVLISGNIANSNNYYGGINVQVASQALIFNNTCNNNQGHGISVVYTSDISILNNTANYNTRNGIDHGNQIKFNKVIGNLNGISFAGLPEQDLTSTDTVSYNLIEDNIQYGLHNLGNSIIYIHHNSFRNNNLGGSSQALENLFQNYWFESATSEGNYWSDWVAGNYLIDGSAGSFDPFPLAFDPWV
jgi:parallel beta-helix repeat protein